MSQPWINGLAVHHALDHLESTGGVDLRAIRSRLGLGDLERAFDAHAPFWAWLELLALGRARSNDPLFAMRAGVRAASYNVSPLSVLASTVWNGRDVVELLLRYWPCSTNTWTWEREDRLDGSVRLRVHEAEPGWADAVQFDLADIALESARYTGQPGIARLVLAGAPERPIASYLGLLGAEPVFHAGYYGLIYGPAECMDAVGAAPLPGVRRFIQPHLEALRRRCLGSLSWEQRVREALRVTQRPASTNSDAIARQLGVSRRSLDRHLAAAGWSFKRLQQERCRELALRWLNERPIKGIADDLGYGSARAFNRAFRRWMGTTPAAWRASTERF